MTTKLAIKLLITAFCLLVLVFILLKVVFPGIDGKYDSGSFVTLTSSGQYVNIKNNLIVHHRLSESEERQMDYDELLKRDYVKTLGRIVYDDDMNMRIIWDGNDTYDESEYYYRTWRGIEVKYDGRWFVVFPDLLMRKLGISDVN